MCQIYVRCTVVLPAYQPCRTAQPIISISINFDLPRILQSSSSRPRVPGIEDQFPLYHASGRSAYLSLPVAQHFALHIAECKMLAFATLYSNRSLPTPALDEARARDPPASPLPPLSPESFLLFTRIPSTSN
jgi:hypothetical protein